MEIIRTRVAPSPTGDPHLGTVRTALFNYLFAKKHNGQFALRIEDTDKTREVEGTGKKFEEILNWLGITPDEGPSAGGQYGPYTQSERLTLYQEHAKQLVDAKHAYYCFCTPERLEALRAEQAKNHQPPRYDRHCRHLTQEEVAEKLQSSSAHVVRLAMPDNEVLSWKDAIKGVVEFQSNEIDDQVLLKSDGYPTYHLASVVDDHEMKMTHVLRGEDWLSSTPKHIVLYKAFGWDMPVFGHFPLILAPDRSKLSKRKGHTSMLYYKDEMGFRPMALVHFMAALGWTPKNPQNTYSFSEMIAQFDLADVGLSPAVFDEPKLKFLGQAYLVSDSIDDVTDGFTEWMEGQGIQDQFLPILRSEPSYAKALVEVSRIRASCYKELLQEMSVLLEDVGEEVTKELLTLEGKIGTEAAQHALQVVRDIVASFPEADQIAGEFGETHELRFKALQDLFRQKQPTDLDGRSYLHPTRVALTRHAQSMNMFDFLAAYLLKKEGKKEVLTRIDAAQLALQ